MKSRCDFRDDIWVLTDTQYRYTTATMFRCKSQLFLRHDPASGMIDASPALRHVGERYGQYEMGPMDQGDSRTSNKTIQRNDCLHIYTRQIPITNRDDAVSGNYPTASAVD